MNVALFPLFLDLRDRPVLVVGGGVVARRKVEALLEAGAQVTVVAPELDAQLASARDEGRLQHRAEPFRPELLAGVWLVIAATDQAEVNRAVRAAADAERVFANVVDDIALSSAQVPARVQRGPLQIAISSGGAAPMLARHLRERLEAQFDESLGALAQLLARARRQIRLRWPDLAARRRFFDRLLAGPIPSLLRRGDRAGAERELKAHLRDRERRGARGRVSLVGAGPGDPGLLTLRALRLLNEADVILYDRLVSPEVLARARRDAERISVGKRAGHHTVPQAQIHELMLEHARAGRHVLRLKGGDPFIFGRGGEELEALRAEGIPYEVVPGITAALACAAYAGIPLTHRDLAQSLRFITGHDRTDQPPTGAAVEGETLVGYMAVANLDRLQAQLIAEGRRPDLPCALIENGSRPQQRVLISHLDGLAALAETEQLQSPALLIVGAVAALAGKLHWYGAEPLLPAPTLSAAA